MLIVGIDVGIGGGLAALGAKVQRATKMPIFEGTKDGSPSRIDIEGVLLWIEAAIRDDVSVSDTRMAVVIEIQRAMPKQGVVSMFHLGESYGLLQGGVIARGWPLYRVQPQAWKKQVLAGTAKDKTAAIEYSRATYPMVDINVGVRKIIYHDGMADAICLAEYGRKTIH